MTVLQKLWQIYCSQFMKSLSKMDMWKKKLNIFCLLAVYAACLNDAIAVQSKITAIDNQSTTDAFNRLKNKLELFIT